MSAFGALGRAIFALLMLASAHITVARQDSLTVWVSQQPGERVHHSGRGNPIFSELPLIWVLRGRLANEAGLGTSTATLPYPDHARCDRHHGSL
jgi:hypothetical protein